MVSRSADSSMASSSVVPVLGVQPIVVRAQRLGRRLDPGQRGAQVVRDRGEQRRTRPVAGLEPRAAAVCRASSSRSRTTPRWVAKAASTRRSAGGERGAAQHQQRRARGRRHRVAGGDRGVGATSSADSAAEGLPDQLEQPRYVVLAAQHGRLSIARVLASPATAAWCLRRAAESTTAATARETTRNSTSVTTLRVVGDVKRVQRVG